MVKLNLTLANPCQPVWNENDHPTGTGANSLLKCAWETVIVHQCSPIFIFYQVTKGLELVSDSGENAAIHQDQSETKRGKCYRLAAVIMRETSWRDSNPRPLIFAAAGPAGEY